jgi:hypothetical protein
MNFGFNEKRYGQMNRIISNLRSLIMLKAMALKFQRAVYYDRQEREIREYIKVQGKSNRDISLSRSYIKNSEVSAG